MKPKPVLRNSFRKVFSWILLCTFLFSLATPSHPAGAQSFQPPTLLLPTANSNIFPSSEFPLAVPDFAWTPVTDATVYRLQISSDIGFANIRYDVTTQNTRFTPTDDNPLQDGSFYWRVRVEAPQVSNYSQEWQFTKTWASAENAPSLTAPNDGAKLDFFNDSTFSWQPVLGAARYRIQIATDMNGFNTPVYSADTFATVHQPNYKFGNGTYYWRVLPLDPFDRAGTPSTVQQFEMSYGVGADGFYTEIPILLAPANNSTPTFTPTFQWTAVRGAEKYILEYTTDPTCSFQSAVTAVETRSTTYTPRETFPNDINVCWHVRAKSGLSTGDWSPTWEFTKQWYIKPVALTPTQNFKYGLYPFFSWTPVPGAAYYRIEVDLDPDFLNLFDSGTTSNPYFSLTKYVGTTNTPYYWRVTPLDGSNNPGKTSDDASFTSFYTATVPLLYYPFYYYVPNNFPPPFSQVHMNPYSDNTAPLPVFMWNRVLNPFPYGGVYADAYRIQVSTTPLFGSSVVWTVDTENLSATPVQGDAFRPSVNQDYFWRVCPLDNLGGSCLRNPMNNDIWWSQIWRARFDPSLGATPTTGSAPQLLRPLQGDEFVEMTPLLEWFPLQNADHYEVQISNDAAFGVANIVDTQSVPYPSYSPLTSLAQRSLGRTHTYGTYYWRVRARVNSSWTGWSNAWRFQIASQTEWKITRAMGDPSNQLQVATDQADATPNFDLTDLNVAQSSDYWFFGFHATASATDMVYGLYLDLDHVDGSGATTSPSYHNYPVTTIAAHQPEYAVMIEQDQDVPGTFTADRVYVYSWNGSGWSFPVALSDMAGGAITFAGGYVEIRIPNTAIGMQDTTNSAAMSLFSVDTVANQIMDSVPSDPNVPGSAQLSRFTSASDRMNTHIPPSNASGDPYTFNYTPPFFWDHPTGSDPTGTSVNPANPFAGHWIEIHQDPQYTSPNPARSIATSNSRYFDQPNGTINDFYQGDNTYYWRVRTRYFTNSVAGTWTNGGSYERKGFVPENLSISISFATPTFTWDMVESAQSYDIQVDTNPNFNSTVINSNTKQNTYTPESNLPNATYYWRVRVIGYGGHPNDWSAPQSFTLSLPVPEGLTTNGSISSITVPYAPTLCWQPLIASDNGTPVLAAWKYRIQVSQTPNFSVIYDLMDTEQNCWTPMKGYDDGNFYWRVAMLDGNNNLGAYSTPAQFIKQYPAPHLLAPLSGSQTSSVPTFKWAPVNGAAYYRIEVSLSPTFGTTIDNTTTNNLHFSPLSLDRYPNDQIYYWRVSMYDRDGKRGPASDATLILGAGIKVFLPFQKR